MSAKRNKVFDGVLLSNSVNVSDIFYEGDFVLIEVDGLADDEFVEFAGSLIIRVKQSITIDVCDDIIRDLFDMGDWEAPLDIKEFNSYALALIPDEYSRSALEMKICIVPSFDITCKIWVIHQDKNVRNLYRYICQENIKTNLQYAALSATLIAQNEALALNTAFVTALATSLGAPGVLPIGITIFGLLQATAFTQAINAGIPYIPSLPSLPTLPLLPP